MRDPIFVYVLLLTLVCYLQQVSSQQNYDLRLVNMTVISQYSGRLEMYDANSNQWGTICIEGFTILSANTACRQLGSSGAMQFGTASQLRFGAGTEPLLLTQVQCGDDDNHIRRCNAQVDTNRCTHNDDVAVICSTEPALQYEGGVRLVGGPYRSEGTLEVFIFNQWYRLCGSRTISEDAARAVCRQLGYTQSGPSNVRRLIDSDTEFTWNTNIDCMGSTTCFSMCYRRPSTVNNLVESCNFRTSLYISCAFDLSIRRISPVGTTAMCSLSGVSDGDDDEESGGLSGGAIAGIVIGSFVIVGVIIFFIVNKDARKKLRKNIESVRTRFRNFRNNISEGLGNCCSSGSSHTIPTPAPSTNAPPPTRDEPIPPREEITLTAVHPIDPNKPPDYNDALKYRKNFDDGYPEPSLVDDGYPEPSLVDQPPSYDAVY